MKSNVIVSAVIIIAALLVGGHEYYRVTKLFSVHLPIFLKNETQALTVQLENSLRISKELSVNDLPINVFPSISVIIEVKHNNQIRTITATNSHVAPPQWFINLFMKSPIEHQVSLYHHSDKQATIYTSMVPNALLKEVWISYIAGLVLFSLLYIVICRISCQRERLLDELAYKMLSAFKDLKNNEYKHSTQNSESSLVKTVMLEFNYMVEVRNQYIQSIINEKNKFEALTQHDELTGLGNKQCFNDMMKVKLREKNGDGGHILLLKLVSLEQINIQLGRQEGDIYISRMANVLNKLCTFQQVEGHVFRSLGSELLVILLNADNTTIDFLAEELKSYLDKLESENYQHGCGYFSIIEFKPGQKLSTLMTSLDCNLSQAMAKYHNGYTIAQPEEATVGGLNHWYNKVDEIIKTKDVSLYRALIKPIGDNIEPYHYEVNASFGGQELSCSTDDIFNAAHRFNLSHKLDQLIITKLIIFLESQHEKTRYAIMISNHSMTNERFRNWLSHLLSHHLSIANRLVFHISELVVDEDLEASRLFAKLIHKAGAQVVLDCNQHTDALNLIERVRLLPADVIKVNGGNASTTLEANSKASFIQTLTAQAHEIKVPVIAGHIDSPNDWEVVNTLGINAGQGPFFGLPTLMT